MNAAFQIALVAWVLGVLFGCSATLIYKALAEQHHAP
jgi:DMSO reductase anchor subunit